jgi:hypothetical protein
VIPSHLRAIVRFETNSKKRVKGLVQIEGPHGRTGARSRQHVRPGSASFMAQGTQMGQAKAMGTSLCCPLSAIRELRFRSPEGGFPRTIVVAAILLRVQPGTVGFDFARAKAR